MKSAFLKLAVLLVVFAAVMELDLVAAEAPPTAAAGKAGGAAATTAKNDSAGFARSVHIVSPASILACGVLLTVFSGSIL
jgi:hypothetical protein